MKSRLAPAKRLFFCLRRSVNPIDLKVVNNGAAGWESMAFTETHAFGLLWDLDVSRQENGVCVVARFHGGEEIYRSTKAHGDVHEIILP